MRDLQSVLLLPCQAAGRKRSHGLHLGANHPPPCHHPFQFQRTGKRWRWRWVQGPKRTKGTLQRDFWKLRLCVCVCVCACVCVCVCVCVWPQYYKLFQYFNFVNIPLHFKQGAIPLVTGGWPTKRPVARAVNVPADSSWALVRAAGMSKK